MATTIYPHKMASKQFAQFCNLLDCDHLRELAMAGHERWDTRLARICMAARRDGRPSVSWDRFRSEIRKPEVSRMCAELPGWQDLLR